MLIKITIRAIYFGYDIYPMDEQGLNKLNILVNRTRKGLDHYVHGGDNYPTHNAKPKPCLRLKNTITYQQPICVLFNGSFVNSSVDNCEGPFKNLCPEFNRASCEMWHDYPCCRLKYYTSGLTWMEIYYTMQYDQYEFKNGQVNDIIEIHRYIGKHKGAFDGRDQDDWPNNVLNYTKERGLDWSYRPGDELTPPLPAMTGAKLCEDPADNRCSMNGLLFQYMTKHYPQGFENIRDHVRLSKAEFENNVTETFSLVLKCINKVSDVLVAPACQILWLRNATYVGARYDTSFVYLEANVYRAPYGMFNESTLRYGYWFEEDPEIRDKMFGTDDFLVNGRDNYPGHRAKPKPCLRLNNTITYQQPICLPSPGGNDGFDPQSRKNCEESFKNTCPEFNKAECVWQSNRPCCCLRYKAEGFDWIKIWYSMQYWPNDNHTDGPLNDIIEVKREINKHKEIKNRDQQDFPNNVMASSQERGLKWSVMEILEKPLPPIRGTRLCHTETDERCSAKGSIGRYIVENYRVGLRSIRDIIILSKAEEANHVKETISYNLSCIKMYNGFSVVPACQVLFLRHASSNGETYDTSFVYLEMNIFPVKKDSDTYKMRYGYWSREDPELRDDIFGTG